MKRGPKKDFKGTVSERLLAKLDKDTKPGCWLWQGVKDKKGDKGYGRIKVNGKYQLTHRVSWQLHNPDKPIPPGMCVLHKCDTPPCVNPEHLKIGTLKDNSQDMVEKGRQARGERQGNSTLKESDVIAIFHDQRSQRKIAKEYGVSKSQVGRIKNRKHWAHVNKEIK